MGTALLVVGIESGALEIKYSTMRSHSSVDTLGVDGKILAASTIWPPSPGSIKPSGRLLFLYIPNLFPIEGSTSSFHDDFISFSGGTKAWQLVQYRAANLDPSSPLVADRVASLVRLHERMPSSRKRKHIFSITIVFVNRSLVFSKIHVLDSNRPREQIGRSV